MPRIAAVLLLAFALPSQAQTNLLADVNGDGQADLVQLTNTQVHVHYSTGTGFQAPVFIADIGQHCAHESGCAAPSIAVGDVDGDGRADIVTFIGGMPSVLVPRSGYKTPSRTPRKMPGT